MDERVEHYAFMAKLGRKEYLEKLIQSLKDPIYDLALRMLAIPEDAEDATQEILIKIITHLSDFRAESRFTTWTWRIAINHLLSIKKYQAKALNITFDFWEEELQRRDPSYDYDALPEPSKSLLSEEVRIICMQVILQCLESKIRIAFILGEVFEMSGKGAAEILEISKAAYRKRLSRGRRKVIEAMQKHCSFVNPDNPCYCRNMIGPDIRDGWIDPDNLQLVGPHCNAMINRTVKKRLNELDEIGRVVAMFRSYPEYSAPDSVSQIVKELIDSKKYKILHH